MMYKELVKRLREPCQYENCVLCKEAADAIEELQRQIDGWVEPERKTLIKSLPRWIPVTERLPESVCKSYLCLTDTGYHCEVRWTNNVYGLWKSDNKWGWSIADVPQYCKVAYWMPLPESPKEDETDVRMENEV